MNIETSKYISTRLLIETLYANEMRNNASYGQFNFFEIDLKNKGLIEECDILNWDGYILRKNAAKIVHLYMKNILGIKDLEDISSAEKLRDLYDCRICVNHIAQVYLRGVMKGIYLLKSETDSDGICIFDSNAYLEWSHMKEIKKNISKIANNDMNI